MRLSECDVRLLRCLIAANGVDELDDLQPRPRANEAGHRREKGKGKNRNREASGKSER